MSARHTIAWHRSLDLVVRSLLEILVVAIFVVTFIAQPFRVPSASMEPTLLIGDFVIADKQGFAPAGPLDRWLPPTKVHRGDVAIFRFPPDPSTKLLKRVIGLPGDRIRLHSGRVLLNGHPLTEPYAFYSPSQLDPYRDEFPFLRSLDPDVDPEWWDRLRRSVLNGEIVVPADCYFVLGDNRNESEDSRYWGFVPRSTFFARPLFVYLPVPAVSATTSGARLRSSWTAVRIVR